jgi:hypothetical protein
VTEQTNRLVASLSYFVAFELFLFAPLKFYPAGLFVYCADFWGLSACDGPSGYIARAVPYGPDDGTISPSATLAALPFDSGATLSAIRHMRARYPIIAGSDVLPSGFNASRAWVSEDPFGLDQGIVALMIENHRSELIWNLMKRCTHVETGLRRAGFRGGWLG